MTAQPAGAGIAPAAGAAAACAGAGRGPLPAPEREARATFTRLAEPGDIALSRLIAEQGAAPTLRRLREGSLGHEPGDPSVRRVEGYRTRLAGADIAGDLERAARAGLSLVCPGEPQWPAQLDDLATTGAQVGDERLAAPWALWVRGALDLRLAALRSVAVIGARAATAYGEHVAGELGSALAQRDWGVVSGAAYGVDGAAHRGALGAGGPTVAVLACGLDVPYPRGHDLLIRRICEGGVVVSELPPGATVTRNRLLQRNRLVAALTRGTVVVEAAVRSGTATTARHAEQLGRVVMAVPGPVTSAASVGCHQLVRDGRAILVTDADDVLDAVGRIGDDAAPVRGAPRRPHDDLDPWTMRVLDALPVRAAVGTARLARTAGLPLGDVQSALGQLLALGLAEPDDGGYRLSAHVRGRRRRGGSPGSGAVATREGGGPPA